MILSEINIYPVKSCAGISLESSELDGMGLKYDRRWMIVDQTGKMITQRSHPQLALIETSIVDGKLGLLSFGMDGISIPQGSNEMPPVDVTVWDDKLSAWHIAEADEWLSQTIGDECRLVQIPDDAVRPCDPHYAQAGDHTGFADGFPLLLISRASLDDLNTRLAVPVEMRRFRPNLVVSGCQAFAEDDWREIRIDEVPMRVVKPCSRCVITTVDPDTGEVSSGEPLKTLAAYREKGGKIFFGQNVIHNTPGRIRLGDTLTVAG